MENWLGLAAETCLFPVVTPLALRVQGCLAGFVLCHLVQSVFLALVRRAEGLARFWSVDHLEKSNMWQQHTKNEQLMSAHTDKVLDASYVMREPVYGRSK